MRRGGFLGRLVIAATLLAASVAWVVAQICPVCGKRSCPWYAARTHCAAPSELIARVRRELLERDPAFQQAKREGRLDLMTARLRKLLIESPELGELLLAVGAGKVAISSRREAAKAISATPFDDGAADGAVVSAAGAVKAWTTHIHDVYAAGSR